MLLKLLLGVWMTLVIIGAFLYAPPAQGFREPEAARIIFFHVPNAIVAFVAFLVSAVFAIKYLRSRSPMDDAKSAVSAGLGFLFALLATVTGALFAYIQWGMAWNWDPRQTSIFILLLIYASYFALRTATEGEERRSTLSAVYNIMAFAAVPFLVFVMPRVMASLHPTDTLANPEALSLEYKIVLYAAMLGFLGLYIWLFRLGTAVAELTLKRRVD